MTFLDDMRASKAVGAKNYNVAIDLYKKRVEADKTDSFAISMLAFCYEWPDNMEFALKYANKQLSQDPTDFHMLLLSARCWDELNDEKQAYIYACRALENIPQSEPKDMPKLGQMILKLLSIFKRYRGIDTRAKEGDLEYAKYHKECIEWARKYKQWYEDKNISIETNYKNST